MRDDSDREGRRRLHRAHERVFDRHLGPSTALGLERGINALWTDGGLMYGPPYR